MRSFVARNEYTSFCRQTWLPVVITSTPAPSSLRAILEVMPAPLAAFSPLAMTKSTARSSRKPGSQRSSASRPGWPNTSPMKRMFMAPVYPTALGAAPTPADRAAVSAAVTDGGAAPSAAEDQPDGALGGPEQRLGVTVAVSLAAVTPSCDDAGSASTSAPSGASRKYMYQTTRR